MAKAFQTGKSSQNDIEVPRRSLKSNWRSGLRGESFLSRPKLSLALALAFLACFITSAVFVPTIVRQWGFLLLEAAWVVVLTHAIISRKSAAPH